MALTLGFFHAFFIVCFGDTEPLGTEIAHRYIIAIVGIGLPIQCLLSAIALNRRLGWVTVGFNCVILGVQLFYVFELIKAVASGP